MGNDVTNAGILGAFIVVLYQRFCCRSTRTVFWVIDAEEEINVFRGAVIPCTQMMHTFKYVIRIKAGFRMLLM